MEGTKLNRLIIIGASRHGKVVADIAKHCGYTELVFLDNNPELKERSGYPVLGPDTMTAELEGEVFVAVGNYEIRQRLMNRDVGRSFPTLIDPSAVIAEDVVIGNGFVVMAGTVINPGAKVGKGCIVNTSSSIDHDCAVGDYCHVSVGSHLSGTVMLGNYVRIGTDATVSNNVNICSDVVIGAGAVVINDVKESGTFIGVPIRKMDSKAKRTLKNKASESNRGEHYLGNSQRTFFQSVKNWRAA